MRSLSCGAAAHRALALFLGAAALGCGGATSALSLSLGVAVVVARSGSLPFAAPAAVGSSGLLLYELDCGEAMK